jgi:NADH-quinone oxidoreductase subunit C
VPADRLFEAMAALRDFGGFDFLSDVTAVDYLHYPDATDRYGVVYLLSNTTTGERVVVKTFVNDPNPTLPSVYPLWKTADWTEREVYDLYGITFTGHPDLRRIMMPDGFAGHPLRKDYPLRGYGERHNHPVLTRAEG